MLSTGYRRAAAAFGAAATLALIGCGGSGGAKTTQATSAQPTQENVQSNVSPVRRSPARRPAASGAAAPSRQACPAGTVQTASGGCITPQPPPQYVPKRPVATPHANTPRGRSAAQQSPDCRHNPPPPGYSGPLQC
jgi:hypothetical protein